MRKKIINLAEALLEDELPKSAKEGLNSTIGLLKGEKDNNLCKAKCTELLEGVVHNENIDSFIRTQLWDVVAAIEQL
tara:strand:+ start:1917 stop:2147 length:231 start_codon:yes stop_codon:yes gene_type:complete